jgi:hypothetical protein
VQGDDLFYFIAVPSVFGEARRQHIVRDLDQFGVPLEKIDLGRSSLLLSAVQRTE